MIRDFCAFSALTIFLYGVGVLALAMDEPPQSAIVRQFERKTNDRYVEGIAGSLGQAAEA